MPLIFACVIVLLAGHATLSQSAQTGRPDGGGRFPDKPIRIIVPFSPGGGTDFMARIVAQKLTEAWGQAVIVDNRPGAGSTLGTGMVAKATPDGHTIGLVSTEHSIMPSIYKQLPYHPARDFTAINQNIRQSYFVVVNPAVEATSIQELIAAIKARNGGFVWGTPHWSVGHLAGELFKLRTGVQMVHVPYKGTGPALIDLMGGQISLMFSSPLAVLPHIRTGKLRALGITGASRSSMAPDLPTVAEAGMPGFEATGWNGFVAPAKTPEAIVARLNNEIVRLLALPDVRDRIAREGSEPVASSSRAFAALIAQELIKWAKVVKDANIRLE